MYFMFLREEKSASKDGDWAGSFDEDEQDTGLLTYRDERSPPWTPTGEF